MNKKILLLSLFPLLVVCRNEPLEKTKKKWIPLPQLPDDDGSGWEAETPKKKKDRRSFRFFSVSLAEKEKPEEILSWKKNTLWIDLDLSTRAEEGSFLVLEEDGKTKIPILEKKKGKAKIAFFQKKEGKKMFCCKVIDKTEKHLEEVQYLEIEVLPNPEKNTFELKIDDPYFSQKPVFLLGKTYQVRIFGRTTNSEVPVQIRGEGIERQSIGDPPIEECKEEKGIFEFDHRIALKAMQAGQTVLEIGLGEVLGKKKIENICIAKPFLNFTLLPPSIEDGKLWFSFEDNPSLCPEEIQSIKGDYFHGLTLKNRHGDETFAFASIDLEQNRVAFEVEDLETFHAGEKNLVLAFASGQKENIACIYSRQDIAKIHLGKATWGNVSQVRQTLREQGLPYEEAWIIEKKNILSLAEFRVQETERNRQGNRNFFASLPDLVERKKAEWEAKAIVETREKIEIFCRVCPLFLHRKKQGERKKSKPI